MRGVGVPRLPEGLLRQMEVEAWLLIARMIATDIGPQGTRVQRADCAGIT